MLCEQDQRAVESMVRCELDLEELCALFPTFESCEIRRILEKVAGEEIEHFPDMHSVSRN